MDTIQMIDLIEKSGIESASAKAIVQTINSVEENWKQEMKEFAAPKSEIAEIRLIMESINRRFDEIDRRFDAFEMKIDGKMAMLSARMYLLFGIVAIIAAISPHYDQFIAFFRTLI